MCDDVRCGGFQITPRYTATERERQLAGKIRHARKQRGLTLGDIARRVGASVPDVSAWERAAGPLPEENLLRRLLAAVGID